MDQDVFCLLYLSFDKQTNKKEQNISRPGTCRRTQHTTHCCARNLLKNNIDVCLHACEHVCMYVCIYIYICIHIIWVWTCLMHAKVLLIHARCFTRPWQCPTALWFLHIYIYIYIYIYIRTHTLHTNCACCMRVNFWELCSVLQHSGFLQLCIHMHITYKAWLLHVRRLTRAREFWAALRFLQIYMYVYIYTHIHIHIDILHTNCDWYTYI
jgi:hypothetical protein